MIPKRRPRNWLVQIASRQLDEPKRMATIVRDILEPLVLISMKDIEAGKVPPLYSSKVYFKPEKRGVETFVDALQTYQTGFGDCAHLSVWLCAEYRSKGEKASIAIQWILPKGFRLFHVVVRRENGTLEDPSAILGMGRR